MTKKILIAVGVLALMLSAVEILAIDTPHNNLIKNINCSSCHDPQGDPNWFGSNVLCDSCHTIPSRAIIENTHSSDYTSTQYGVWYKRCLECHHPHFQRQQEIYKTESYVETGVSTSVTTTTLTGAGKNWDVNEWAGYLLLPDTTKAVPGNFMYKIDGNTVDTIILDNSAERAKNSIDTGSIQAGKSFAIIYGKLVRENMSSGVKTTIKFFGPTGPNSFADGDVIRDGICEVCHTKTTYHRKDGLGTPHNEGTRCTECHEHVKGFKAECSGCHGNPPLDVGSLVSVIIGVEYKTGSNTAGAHSTHVNSKGVRCGACHFDSVGTGITHNSGDREPHSDGDYMITLAFNPFNGLNAGGTYDGQGSASYNSTTTTTFTTNGGSLECSNIYCHGATMAPNGGTDTTPIWNVASTGACGTCHGATTVNPPLLGSHSKHAGTSTLQASVACDVCHRDYTHVNTKIEWKFATGKRTAVATYRGVTSGSDVMGSFSYGSCTQLYCHSNAAPERNKAYSDPALTDVKDELNTYRTVTWGDPQMECDSCHLGTLAETTSQPVCSTDFTDFLSKNHTMKSNGHYRLVGPCSARQYECYFCHDDTMDAAGNIKDKTKHANGIKDVKMSTEWEMVSMPAPTYNSTDWTCDNLYCHSDGTKIGTVRGVTVYPEVRAFPWNAGKTACESCHGHQPGSCPECHDGTIHDNDGKYWPYLTGWLPGEEWKGAVPMLENGGPGTERENSHQRHMEKDFSCESCHNNTVISTAGFTCNDCHTSEGVVGSMGQTGHLRADFHVNQEKDVDFNTGEDPKYHATEVPGLHEAKSCENTVCHPGQEPVWGGSSFIACEGCHGTTGPDVDDFNWGDVNKISYCGGEKARINTDEWRLRGHGRKAIDGNYPISGNPPADFEAKGENPCAFCHDSEVLHNEPLNPFRLRLQQEFADRFDKECVYCHMKRLNTSIECMDCHVRTDEGIYESIAPEATENGILFKQQNGYWLELYPEHGYTKNCMGIDPLDPIAGCHDSDIGTFPLPSTAHKGHNEIPDGQEWTTELQDDVRNQYNMMGVCLKCHEEDSNGECTACHEAPVDKPNKYLTGFDPDGEGTKYQRVRPVKARATSVHYGYKHYQQGIKKGGKFCWDCHDPHGDSNIYMIQDKVAVKSDGLYGVPKLKMYADGVTSLPVVTSTCASYVGGTVVDYRKPVVFTDNIKGADSKTDDQGVYYARTTDWVEEAGKTGRTYNGICNVCHQNQGGLSRHFGADYGEGAHHASQKCTQCHEHRFTSGHAGDKACNSCHGNKPVPSHTAFGLPRDCTKCHEGAIYGRMNIMGQMRTNSHHVQGAKVTNKHCYACHWEATESGLINNEILPGTSRIAHEGYDFKTHISVPNAASDLVIWGQATTRPTTYQAGTTAIQFTATSIGTITERQNVGNVTKHCLSCHNTAQNYTQPFSEYGVCSNESYYSKDSCISAGVCSDSSYSSEYTCSTAGFTWTNYGYTWSADCKTPRQYAWDGTSIDERYSNMGTTTWGKYTTTSKAAQKNITKSYSAHGNATANAGGWGAAGLDGAITNTRNGTNNVQCYDCHSSHGSSVAGTTSSYVSFSGNYNGGNLKETSEGKGGYNMRYKASKNLLPGAVNPYQPGSGQCFDCHETQTTVNVFGNKPWGYQTTFGATAAIIGYNDTLSFASNKGPKQSQVRYAFKAGRPMVGGHLQASSGGQATSGSFTSLVDTSRTWTVNQWANNYVTMKTGANAGQSRMITSNTANTLTVEGFANEIIAGDAYFIMLHVPEGFINGLCTPCHDPHGVSSTLGAGMRYAVPLLKGTWLTSPYQEDTAPDNLTGANRFQYTSFADTPFDYAVWKPTYWIDQNTFGPGTGVYPGQNGGEANTWNWSTPTKISENDAQFAGLCLKCHPKSSIDPDTTTAWRSMDRIHETVKGWGGQGQDANNAVHAFTCSKCHQPHVSGLPRLMVTDCLDDNHKGKVVSGGSAANSRLNYSSSRGKGGGTYPYGGFGNEGQPPSYGWGYYSTNHSIGFGGGYNKTLNTCHVPAGGTEDWRLRQRWNTKTPW